MATQTQGKGRKKNKETTKVSLDEFNSIDAPHGHSVVSLKITGLDWAETMADYDQQSDDTQQIIVPTAPRAQRGPGVDIDSLPNEPPFRVSLFNLAMSAEERDIEKNIFQGLDIVKIESSRQSTTVELGSRDHLYEALCKDGTTHKGKTLSVCLFGHQPQGNYGADRYGGRGGGSYGDRYGDRGPGGYGSARSGDRFGGPEKYGDRPGGFGRDRDREGYGGGFNRSGFGGQRGGYGERFNDRSNFRDNNRGQYTSGGGEPPSEEPTNWRARPSVKPASPVAGPYNGSRQSYMHSRSETSQHYQQEPPYPQQNSEPHQPRYQPPHHSQPPSNSYSNYNNQPNNRPQQSSSEERPKLVLQKRKTPINIDDVSSVTRNEAIFGQAKPTSLPYQKMEEIEEKLKTVQITDKKERHPTSLAGSQGGSRPGSAPRSRRVSSNHSESNS